VKCLFIKTSAFETNDKVYIGVLVRVKQVGTVVRNQSVEGKRIHWVLVGSRNNLERYLINIVTLFTIN